MKTNEIQKIDSTRDSFFYALIAIVLCFYSPFCIRVMHEAAPAVLFTAYLWLFPDSLRTRSGSLVPAFCLTGFLWLCTAVVFALSYFGTKP
jgi:hypothetical protein